MTGMAGRLGCLGWRWGCGHAEESGDSEDSHGEGSFEPDRSPRHLLLPQTLTGNGGGGDGAGNQDQLDRQGESVAGQP